MTRDVVRFVAPDFLSLTIGIVVFFIGALITQRVKILQNFSIPEPVSGGFIAVVVISLIYLVFNLQIDFDLTTRDRLLVIFFATVGINSRLADLVAGGGGPVVPWGRSGGGCACLETASSPPAAAPRAPPSGGGGGGVGTPVRGGGA